MPLKSITVILISALILAACQTPVISMPPQTDERQLTTLIPPIPDSDGDGVLDTLDYCPKTPKHTVVNAKGCQIIIDGGEALEMEFNGYFTPLSSQFFDRYDKDFAKIAEKLNENPDAKVFIFGQASANELAMLPSNAQSNTDNLSRRRAIMVKNKLITEHNIAPSRIITYDCLDQYPSHKLYLANNDLKNNEDKGRRVTLTASTQVNDLTNIKNASDLALYEDYIKYCQPF
ncbi:OmpA family protein [uncultured Psychrobacter sp.]|uniref:OmpA family protein n=1 Tax=uncultured Psychrobacter sp. TaxID=259303 RepID=UPI00345A7428